MEKTVFVVMVLTLFSKLLGFCREIALSYYYGTSSISDAYLISATIPEVFFNAIGVGILTSYIPLYNKIAENEGIPEADNFTNQVITMNMVICSVLFFSGSIFTRGIVKLFASGFEGGLLNLTIHFTRIAFFGVFFTGLTGIYKGYLQIKNNFWAPALIGIPWNFFIITSIILSSKGNLKILPLGIVAASAAQFLCLVPSVRIKKYRYRFSLDKHGHLKELFLLAVPLIIGVSIEKVNLLVDRTLASKIASGGITTLVYADKVNSLVMGIFVLPLITVMYPQLTRLFASNDIHGMKKRISDTITSINLLTVPAVTGILIFAEPFIETIYGRGAFDSDSISATSSALFFYSVGIIGFGLREVLARVFYSMQDTKTPMLNATIAIILNIILNFLLSSFMGIDGLALATSISWIFGAFLLLISLKKRMSIFRFREASKPFFKILMASLMMGGGSKLFFNALITKEVNQNISLIASIFIGGLLYFTIIFFMKIQCVDNLVESIRIKVRNLKR